MKRIALFLAVVLVMTTALISCGSEKDYPEKDYPVEFTISEATASAGETVSVEVTVAASVDANAYMLYDLSYDKDVLEFVGFTNLGDAGEKSIFGEAGLDQKLGTVSIALTESEKLTGKICEISFKVKDDVKPGKANIFMKSVVKNSSDPIESVVVSGFITVK